MDSDLNLNNLNKMMTKGKDELKTSFFSLKFSPDYLSAVGYFTEAGKGFRKLKMFNESLGAFTEAVKCNKHLNESWGEGQNLLEMAEICIFNLNDFSRGWGYLKNSSLMFKIGGKFTTGVKVYQDISLKLQELGRYEEALILLKEGFEDCIEQTHDQLIRISFEDVFVKLIDVLCALEKYTEAVEIMEKYIKSQLGMKDEPKHKVSKNYIKLAMLRIVINELYMAEHIIDQMYPVRDSNSSEDIEDLLKLINAFKTGNKKDFNFSMTCAFSLFQNNLLKAVRKVWDKKEQERVPVPNSTEINLNENTMENISVAYTGCDETKADSALEHEANVEENANAEDYL